MTAAETTWWTAHGQELVDTMCWAGSADVVGLLADNTSYGVFGDHGGAQKDVQRIPMAFFMPKMQARGGQQDGSSASSTSCRPCSRPWTSRRRTPMDGTAYDLPFH